MDTIFNISSLSDVSPIKFAWSILVKVLHTWISSCHQFGSSLEMVLTDINVRKYSLSIIYIVVFAILIIKFYFLVTCFRVSKSMPVANKNYFNESRDNVVLENGKLLLTLHYVQHVVLTDPPTMFTKWSSWSKLQ